MHLEEELRVVDHALKSLEQKRRREDAIRQRQGLTQRMCRVVLAIFCLSNYCLDFALEYAKSASRKRRKIWNLEEPEPCLIQEWFLATPVDQLLTLLHPETPADQSVHVEASKYVATRRVVAWLVDENFKRFRAPDALQLVAQYGVELRRFDLQHGFRVDRCSGAQLNSAGRHWVRTLKRRFGISRRYLPLAEPLSADHVQTKVSTFWWWLDYLAAQVGPGKRILWLNADETSLSRVGAKKAVGHIVSKRWWPTRLGPKRPCQKDQRRASVTHIACMCSETSVQPHLPQVFLGAKRSMPAAATLVEHPQIQIWRRDTAWNTTSTMLQWLDLLASRLLPFTEFQPILLLDMAPCHLSPVIAEKASSLGFFLAYVPARLTSLVQPADVAMFAGYKVNLVKLLLQNESLAGEVSLEAWIECLGKVCRQYLCGKKWKKAFERTGIIPGGILTPELAQIAAPRLCVSPLPCPDFDSVASLFPKGRRVPYTSLFWVPAQMDPPLLE